MEIVYVPRVNPNDETVIVNKLVHKNGSSVKANETVVEIETAKVAQEIEAPIDGYIEYACEEGAEIEVGSEIFRIHESEFESKNKIPLSEASISSERKVSKKAEVMLIEHGLSPSDLPGSGVVTPKHVEKFLEINKTEVSKTSQNKISSSQQMVANNLRLSVDTNVHARLTARIQINIGSIPNGATILDLMAVSVSKALSLYSCFNESLSEDIIKTNDGINIGFTLDLDGKLLISSIPSCEKLTIEEFLEKRTELMMNLMRGSGLLKDNKPTFVISVIEGKHIDMHYPIIFPGNSGILAVAVQESDSDIKNIGLCIAYDHRMINGAVASNFLDEIISELPIN
tara:strand:- start:2982 stop:4007 length:1026 start_codon:yes stop_codon:yes gene_type:complete